MELCQQAQASADQQAGENLTFCHPGFQGNTGAEWTVGGTNRFYEEVNDYFDFLDKKTRIFEIESLNIMSL